MKKVVLSTALPLTLAIGAAVSPAALYAAETTNTENIMISDIVNVSGEYEDSVDNFYNYSYRLPAITGPQSEYLDEISAEVARLNEEIVDPELENMKGGYTPGILSVDYDYSNICGVYSLMIYGHDECESTFCQIYHFDEEGNELTNSDVLAAVGMDEETFVNKAYYVLKDHITDTDNPEIPEDIKKELVAVNEQTLSEDNCNVDMPIYLTDSGKVCFVGRVYSVAGASYYDHFYIFTSEDVFSEEDLSEMALDYYQGHNGVRPQNAACEADGDVVVIQLYSELNGHNSSFAWYRIDPFSAAGFSAEDEEIDLTNPW